MGDFLTHTASRNAMLGRLGTFWSEGVTRETKDQARGLSRSVLHGHAPGSVLSTGLETNTSGDVSVDFLSLNVGPSNSFSSHVQLADQLTDLSGNPENWVGVFARPLDEHPAWTALYESGVVLGTEYTQILLWYDPSEEDGTVVSAEKVCWVVSVPNLVTCTRIQRTDGTWMFQGLDFHSAPGVVLLYQDPSVVFPSQKTVACGFRPPMGMYNYTLQLDGITTPGFWVMEYYRKAHGVVPFTRALAEASGLHVWYHDGHIAARRKMPVGYTYWTEHEKVNAWYPHTGLPEGSLVSRGDVLADEGDFGVVPESGSLEINLREPLFLGIFERRAREFIRREKPVGIPITVNLIEET